MERRRPRRWQRRGPDHERWMISYADMLTLLLTVFIMLWASASTDKAKLEKEAAGLLEAFTGTPPSLVPMPSSPHGPFHALPKPIPVPLPTMHTPASPNKSRPATRTPMREQALQKPPGPQKILERKAPSISILPIAEQRRLQPIVLAMSTIRQQLQTLLAPEIARRQIAIFQLPLAIRIRLNAQILFNTGDAALTKEALTILDPIGDVLANVPPGYLITIQGYTDNRPIRTASFASNWELSTARAVSVVKLFRSRGVPGEALSAQGYSKFQPIASNATPEGQARNRRVEIVITAPKPAGSDDGG